MARANKRPRKKYGSKSPIQLYVAKDGITLNVTTWPFQKLKLNEAEGYYDQELVPGIILDGVRL